MSRALLNFAGYQLVWLAAVLGAGRGTSWPALAGLAAFAALQLASSCSRRADLRLLVLALALGVLLDGTLAYTALVRYAAPSPALPAGGAPLWILALWGAFALTLNHSLAWLRGRPALAAALGAAGGPLAYAAAARLAGAVQFGGLLATGALAAGWAGALSVLSLCAHGWARLPARPMVEA
ncbi:MAG: DUF2878 family protein [Gammaproteobacteria bacterium]|nr:DUF2878 family protein [Gammaproteobacteria bacterium]